MVSGKSSKSQRGQRGRTAVVAHRATPWGLIAAVVVVVLFAGGVFGYAFLQSQAGNERQEALAPFTPSPENPNPSAQIEGVVSQEFPQGLHVPREQQVAYTFSPPIGGAHDGDWAACNGVVYPEAVRSENLVHSLEHGAVWIAYNPDQVSGDALTALEDRVNGTPYMVMSPYPGLDSPISLQSWGHQLKLDDANDPRIDQFITALRVNPNTHPEVGASCVEIGPGRFSQSDPPPFAPIPAPGTPGAAPEVPETPGAEGVAPDQGS